MEVACLSVFPVEGISFSKVDLGRLHLIIAVLVPAPLPTVTE